MKFRTLKKKEEIQAGDISCDLSNVFTDVSEGDLAGAYQNVVLRPVVEEEEGWRDLENSENWEIGDRWKTDGVADRWCEIKKKTTTSFTVGDWKTSIYPLVGHAQRRVEKPANDDEWRRLKDDEPTQIGDRTRADDGSGGVIGKGSAWLGRLTSVYTITFPFGGYVVERRVEKAKRSKWRRLADDEIIMAGDLLTYGDGTKIVANLCAGKTCGEFVNTPPWVGGYVERRVETPAPDDKWRRLDDSETIQDGDRLTYPKGKKAPAYVGCIGLRVGKWVHAEEYPGGYVERRVEKAKVSKWHRVEDILPDNCRNVLVQIKYSDELWCDNITISGSWRDNGNNQVIRWREMPKGPKESK